MPIIHSPTTPHEHIHSLLDNPIFDEIERAENENPFGKYNQPIKSTKKLISFLQPYLSHFFPENNLDLKSAIKSLPNAIRGNLFFCTNYLLDFDINQLDAISAVLEFIDQNGPDWEDYSYDSSDPIISIINFEENFEDIIKSFKVDLSPDQALALRSLSYYLEVIINLENPDLFYGKDIVNLHLADRCLFEAEHLRIRNTLGKRLQKPSESDTNRASINTRYQETNKIKRKYIRFRNDRQEMWKFESHARKAYINTLSPEEKRTLSPIYQDFEHLNRILKEYVMKNKLQMKKQK